MRCVVLRNSTADAETDDELRLVILTKTMTTTVMMTMLLRQLDEMR